MATGDQPAHVRRTHPHFDSTHRTKSGNAIDVSLTISPIRDPDGGLIGASAIVRDIKDRKNAEQRSALLLGELDHRVKNILAVVASIVSQTLKTMESPAAFAASIEGRIQAIAKSHNLITQAGRTGISLGAMIRTELAAYDETGERVTVSGGDVTLTPKAGMALGMAFHELTTNAAKYGALSTPDGRLAIRWNIERREDGPSLRIEWEEKVERAITRPEKSGFGTVLIERALALELDAEVKREFRSPGLFCRIDIPLTEEIASLPETAMAEDPR